MGSRKKSTPRLFGSNTEGMTFSLPTRFRHCFTKVDWMSRLGDFAALSKSCELEEEGVEDSWLWMVDADDSWL